MRGPLDEDFARRRAERERIGRQRQLEPFEPLGACRVRRKDAVLVDFCSNDYLGFVRGFVRGFAQDPDRSVAAEAVRTGSAASPLISGYSAAHHRLSTRLAEFLGAERALLTVSGYQANLALGQALLGRKDALLADRLNHASLNDGARLAGARVQRYRHADPADAQRRLDKRTRWLATDSVFSMDGDRAPLRELAQLADCAGIGLWVDDAHGFGIVGPDGRGAVAAAGIRPDALVVTFGKSVGTQGAAIVGDHALIDEVVNIARGVIYSTAMSPLLVAATEQALDRMQREGWRRDALGERIRQFRDGLKRAGLSVLDSDSPIQPLIVGADRAAVLAEHALAERGFLVRAIRPPTVPEGSARLRITLSAAHTAADVDRLVGALAEVLGRSPAVSADVDTPDVCTHLDQDSKERSE